MFGLHELHTFLKNFLLALGKKAIHSVSFRLFLLGMLLGPVVLAILHQYYVGTGSTLEAKSCGLIAIAIGMAWASRKAVYRYKNLRSGWYNTIIPTWIKSTLCLAFWSILLPSAVPLQALFIERFELSSLTHSSMQWFYFGVIALVTLTLPAYWTVRTVSTLASDLTGMAATPRSRNEYQRYLLRYFTGLVVGIGCVTFFIAPLWGLQSVAWACTLCLVIICIERLVQGGSVKEHSSPVGFQTLIQDKQALLSDQIWQIVIWACMGGLVILMQRMFVQYMPGTIYLPLAVWTGVLIGLLYGSSFFTSKQSKYSTSEWEASSLILTIVLASAWSVLWLLSSDLLVAGSLWISAYWSQTWLITLTRIVCIIVAVAPLGAACARTLLLTKTQQGVNLLSCFRGHRSLSFVGGCLLVSYLLSQQVSFNTLVLTCQWVLLAMAGLRWAKTWKFSYNKPVLGGLSCALVLIIAAPITNQQFDTGITAKYLFSGEVFSAYRNGESITDLEVLDCNRLTKLIEGESASYTIWSQHGQQQVVRANGMPQAISSLDLNSMPEQTGEVLQTILPLSIHRAPHEVLLLGVPSGVSVKSCLQFPIQKLTCCETETALLDIARESVWANNSPENDIRYEHLNLAPKLALQKITTEQDVIISSPPLSMLHRSAEHYTVEFYQHAAACLSRDGIFCQRFQHVDYGTQPLCDVITTLRTAFQEVCTIQSAPGELLLVATNSELGIDRNGMLGRFRKPHTRRVLASLGWDWAVPLEILQLDDDSWTEILKQHPGNINTAANGILAYSLPHEMLRWGNKAQEMQQMASVHFNNIYTWVKDEDKDHQVSHRFDELKSFRDLQATNTGQYWTYRSPLRTQVKEKPRTVIKQVKGEASETVLHKEDRRRLEYFFNLGQAFQSKEMTLEELNNIEQFTEPYDPLLSYFAHLELAELSKRLPKELAQEELRHLLYTIHFGSSQDKSVRNVSRVLSLLAENPEVVSDIEKRADLTNSMLQVLKQRWIQRGTIPVGTLERSQQDVTLSLKAIETAFDTFAQFQQHEKLKSYPWDKRQEHLERSIVSPLRTFRSNLSLAKAKTAHEREKSAAKTANLDLELQNQEDADKLNPTPANKVDNASFELPEGAGF